MPKIICVNEKGKVYATPEDLEKIVHYVYNPLKTTEDVLRPGHGIGDYTRCYPFMGPEYLIHNETAVSAYMLANNAIYGKSYGNLIRHWVISFHKADYIMPCDAADLGNFLIRVIGENYISAFGVHIDTKYIHIHLIINCIGWRDGKRYDVPFEGKWISSMVEGWYRNHTDNLLKDMEAKRRCERYLYGEY